MPLHWKVLEEDGLGDQLNTVGLCCVFKICFRLNYLLERMFSSITTSSSVYSTWAPFLGCCMLVIVALFVVPVGLLLL